tara:strand:+ start:473 stop:850 length:378 start_codon:yes stop_codon:yes gene_type:complete
MTKEHAHMNSATTSRRTLLTALPALGVALALPSSTPADDRGTILEVIRELESWQDWETSSVVAAKAYAAYRLREAMGLDLPDPENARMHLHYQGRSFEDYSRTAWFERDRAEGKIIVPPRSSTSI